MAMMQGRPGNGLQVFDQLLSSRYNVKSIALEKDEIPEGPQLPLIITKPTHTKFTRLRTFPALDQALMKGTNVAVFADAFNEQQPAGRHGHASVLHPH